MCIISKHYCAYIHVANYNRASHHVPGNFRVYVYDAQLQRNRRHMYYVRI